jgi:hypothetical protein
VHTSILHSVDLQFSSVDFGSAALAGVYDRQLQGGPVRSHQKHCSNFGTVPVSDGRHHGPKISKMKVQWRTGNLSSAAKAVSRFRGSVLWESACRIELFRIRCGTCRNFYTCIKRFKIREDLDCEPITRGFFVQIFPCRQEYPAGFTVYITLASQSRADLLTRNQ